MPSEELDDYNRTTLQSVGAGRRSRTRAIPRMIDKPPNAILASIEQLAADEALEAMEHRDWQRRMADNAFRLAALALVGASATLSGVALVVCAFVTWWLIV